MTNDGGLSQQLVVAIRSIREDRVSGASEMLARAVDVLERARRSGEPALRAAARALVRAQPCMAPLWKAAGLALADRTGQKLAGLMRRAKAAPRAIANTAAELAALRHPREDVGATRIATVSYSATVAEALSTVAKRMRLTVLCAEARPGLEGQRLADSLAKKGIEVEFYVDAAMGHALSMADVVWVGADAVTAGRFLNKIGTDLLAARAAQHYVPVYVLVSRDKFVPEPWAAALAIEIEHNPDEVWSSAPEGVRVRNPSFAWTSLDLVAGAITEAGLLGPDVIADACHHEAASLPPALLELLL